MREAAARAAVREVERALAETTDGALVGSEPRLKVLPGGRCDARLVSAFAAAYAGTEGVEGVERGAPVAAVDVESAHADIARRCAELLRAMPTTLAEDVGTPKAGREFPARERGREGGGRVQGAQEGGADRRGAGAGR